MNNSPIIEIMTELSSVIFGEKTPTANPVFYRSYSQRTPNGRENYGQVCERTIRGLQELGKLSHQEVALITKMQIQLKTLPSGRWLWIGGTDWVKKPKNFSGAYNCTSTNIDDLRSLALLMDLAMMGSGTGAVLEPEYINKLPSVQTKLEVQVVGQIGDTEPNHRQEHTTLIEDGGVWILTVGDSREGWVDAYYELINLSMNKFESESLLVQVDVRNVRPAGEPLKGFGGIANPVKLVDLFYRVAAILNKAIGRQLDSVELCLLIGEAASTIVAGNLRRSAGMRQAPFSDKKFANSKTNLWQQKEDGTWCIDPERDALRMANHSRVCHQKPTRDECIEAVRQQYYSGEGAIQWAGEAVARASCDLIPDKETKQDFLKAYNQGRAKQWISDRHPSMPQLELEHRLQRYGLNPCGEIIGSGFHCVSGETLLITRDGLHKIKDVSDEYVEIWNGTQWSKVKPFQTGINQKLYRVQFTDGSYLDATEYHRFFVKDRFNKTYKEVQTKDLMDVSRYAIHTEPFVIEYQDGLDIDTSYAYTLGVALGDGTTTREGKAIIKLYGEKMKLQVNGKMSELRNYDYLPNFCDVRDLDFSGEFLKALKRIPASLDVIATWNKSAILSFIAGVADTDGSNTSGNGIRIYVSGYERAYRFQLLLTKCGIRSSVNLCAHKGSETNLGIRSQDLYYLQITDCKDIPCKRLDTSKGCQAKYKGKWQVVRSVEELPGRHDTYCFNEPQHHKGVFGNTLTGNCNLSEIHLNLIDPNNHKEQEDAFKAGALCVAALLHHKFLEPRYQFSREIDPIVGVSFTGLFDFFVNAFGVEWLKWWEAGRPKNWGIGGKTTKYYLSDYFTQKEAEYLNRWRNIVHETVWDYCDRHGLRRPNRCTTVQPAGSKSLLTGASPGWHPPKAQRFIRRITFGKNDPIALACIDYGYSVVPSQSDKDEEGNLLNDPFDPRCSEWLVEIPIAVSWADLPGADSIDISQFSALAQMDFYLQVQNGYVTHNTSATIEVRQSEIKLLGNRIYEAIANDEGYISAALLARYDDRQSFPRFPFEPIDKAEYDRLSAEVLIRRKTNDFHAALTQYDNPNYVIHGPAACDSDKCLLPEKPEKH